MRGQRAPFRWNSAEVSAHKHANGIAEQVENVRHLSHFRAVGPFLSGVVLNAFKTTPRVFRVVLNAIKTTQEASVVLNSFKTTRPNSLTKAQSCFKFI